MICIQDEVLEFIHRRFPIGSHFLDGNCYYFSVILKARFRSSKMMYDVISGHFVTLINGKFYDWSGEVKPDGYLVEWDKYDEYDKLQKQVIVRDCVM